MEFDLENDWITDNFTDTLIEKLFGNVAMKDSDFPKWKKRKKKNKKGVKYCLAVSESQNEYMNKTDNTSTAHDVVSMYNTPTDSKSYVTHNIDSVSVGKSPEEKHQTVKTDGKCTETARTSEENEDQVHKTKRKPNKRNKYKHLIIKKNDTCTSSDLINVTQNNVERTDTEMTRMDEDENNSEVGFSCDHFRKTQNSNETRQNRKRKSLVHNIESDNIELKNSKKCKYKTSHNINTKVQNTCKDKCDISSNDYQDESLQNSVHNSKLSFKYTSNGSNNDTQRSDEKDCTLMKSKKKNENFQNSEFKKKNKDKDNHLEPHTFSLTHKQKTLCSETSGDLTMQCEDYFNQSKHTCNVKRNISSSMIREKALNRLNAARFRYLNEKLYTSTSKEALQMFHNDPASFKVYHEGYKLQVSKWPINPVNIIIQDIEKAPLNAVIADFGCGEAKIAQIFVNRRIYSFDLLAVNEYVTACDIAKVPLHSESVDIAVFCLSLMGTNLQDYLAEANRVLKKGGLLKIAEIESRFSNIESFISILKKFGFSLLSKEQSHKMFVFFDFKKTKGIGNRQKLPSIQLQPCLYKKR
ncbi:ribosomal RNA-processing protein 8-like [Limulus polyphemus]|uniref:Ribosomal RNA-processing protein 8 n=1 Tax=Limulus polyphemus TaxID=6850 RepID=A0ABM1BX95_LIMPO|nr:ribosomal RNA-processing protein 8-like [Limulus polyphemus]